MQHVLDEAWRAYNSCGVGRHDNVSGTLQQLFETLAEVEAPSSEDAARRAVALSDLNDLLGSLGGLACEAHGGFVSGSYSAGSVLDLAVTGAWAAAGKEGEAPVDVEALPAAERQALLERAFEAVQGGGMSAPDSAVASYGTALPSISFQHAATSVAVRLCVARAGFAFRSHAMRGLAKVEPRLLGLMQLVELWAAARGINSPTAGTFSPWVLSQMVVFALQTFQPEPLLPPLWRLYAEAGPMGPPLPPAVRPLQHQYLQSMSSKDLQPALEAMVERCSGPREALGLSPAAATTAHSGESCARGGGPEAQHEAGLLQLFGWFLTMMDGLLAGWQLSWNRRFRVSTWHGQLQQQPFTRPFLVPVEDPFDPADNAAKAFGCENQQRHVEAVKAVAAEVRASLQVLVDTKEPADLDRAMLELFGLELEHLYLAGSEDDEPSPTAAAWAASPGAGPTLANPSACTTPAGPRSRQATVPLSPGPAAAPGGSVGVGGLRASASASGALNSPIAEVRARLVVLQDMMLARQQSHPAESAEASPMRPSPHFRPQARHASASPSPGGFAARLALHPTRLGANAGGNASAVEQPEGAAPTLTPGSGTPGVVHAAAAVTPPRPPPAILAVQLPPDQEAPVPQPQPGSSQRGGQPGGHHKRSGSGLPAGVAAMSPLRQGLQDVTNSPSLGHSASFGNQEQATGQRPANARLFGSPRRPPYGGRLPLPLNPFEEMFTAMMGEAKNFIDSVAQGMTELGRDVAVLAHTAVHSLHHALVEDLPAVSGRHQRRHRLQLLHRPAGAAAAAGHQALLQQQQQLRQLQPGQGGQEAEEQLSPPSCGGTELKVLATPRQPQPQHVLAEEGGPVPKALWPDGADAAAEAVGPEADGAAAVPVDAGAPLPGSSGAEDAPVLLSDTMFDQLDAQTAEMRSAPLTGRTPKQLLAAPAAEAAAERTACTAAACATSRPVDGDGVPAIAGPDANMPAQPRCTGEDGVRAEATAAAEANRPPGEAVPGPAAEPPAASVAQRRAPAPQDALSAEADTSAGLATTSAAAALPPMPASSVTPGAAEGTGDSAAKAGSGAGGTGPSSACGSCPATATPSALSTPAKSARSSRMATPSKHAQQAALCAASATTAAAGDRPGLAHAALASGGGVLRVKSAAFRKGPAREPALPGTLSGGSEPAASGPPRIALSSGLLQELADCLDRAAAGTTIDLQGGSFCGPLAHPAMRIAAPEVTLCNGAVVLQPEQHLVVSGKQAQLVGLTVRDAPLALLQQQQAPAAMAAIAPAVLGRAPGYTPAALAASKPAILVTKQSYTACGGLAMRGCSLQLAARSHGLHVKGKGCTALADGCTFGGSAAAAVLASDAASVSLAGCTFTGGGGPAAVAVCVRDGGSSATLRDCRAEGYHDGAVAVLAGGSCEMTACTLDGSGVGGSDSGGGPCLLVDGKGATATARGGAFTGSAQAGVCATRGGSCTLEGCRASGNQDGVAVGIRGGRLVASRCELSGNARSGLAVLEGATADLRDCTLDRNGGDGLRVGGVGCMAVARGCSAGGNAGRGMAVEGAGGSLQLETCNAAGNVGGPGLYVAGHGARAVAKGCTFEGNAGAGVCASDFATATLTGCAMARNMGPGGGVEVGAHARVVLTGGCSWAEGHGGRGLRVDASGSLEIEQE